MTYIDQYECVPCVNKFFRATNLYLSKFPSDSIQYVCVMYPRPIEEIKQAMDSLDLPQTLVVYDKDDQYLKKNSLEKYTYNFWTFGAIQTVRPFIFSGITGFPSGSSFF